MGHVAEFRRSVVSGVADHTAHVDAHANRVLLGWARDVGQRFRVHAGTVVLSQGDRADKAVLLESGRALVFRAEPTGLEHALGLCGPDSLLGLTPALRNAPATLSVVMKTAGEVTVIPAERLHAAFGLPDLRGALLARMASDFDGLVERYVVRTSRDARSRLLALLREATDGVDAHPCPVPLTVADVASLIGVDDAHARKLLRGLREEGVVHFSRGDLAVSVPLDRRPDHATR